MKDASPGMSVTNKVYDEARPVDAGTLPLSDWR